MCVVQCLGAIVAAALVSALFSGGLNVSTTLSTTTSLAQGFFIELILTAQLVFAIFMLAAEKHAGTFIAPVGIGLALFIAELTGKPTHPVPNDLIESANQNQEFFGRVARSIQHDL